MSENFARGRSAEIFDAGDGKVMKLFFEDYPREYAEKEYKNTKVVSELGCTSMKVYDKVEKDGRFGFIMDFIDGVSQNDMPSKNPAYIFKAGKDLARCHVEVQAKHTRELDDIREKCVELLGTEPLNILTDEEKRESLNRSDLNIIRNYIKNHKNSKEK